MPHPCESPKLGIVILCGGKSRRMGCDKAALPFPGEGSMLARIVRLATQAVPAERIVCVAAQGQTLPDLPILLRTVRDRTPDCGPLEGIATGLAALTGTADAALVTTCDSPILVPQLPAHLATLLGEHDAAVPRVEGRWQPLTALYRTALAPRIDAMLGRGMRRVIDMVEQIDTCEVTLEELKAIDPGLQSAKGCNTPEEYDEIIRIASQSLKSGNDHG